MATMDFPSGPANGATYQGYTFDGTAWNYTAKPGLIICSDTPPANPPVGQQWFRTTNGQLYVYVDDGTSRQWVQCAGSTNVVKTARPGNRITNSSALISQENGSTAITAGGAYPADQWALGTSGSITGATAQRVNLAVPSPDGAQFAVSLYATTAKASLASNDILATNLYVEGYDIADFLWGTPDAKDVVLRFNAYADVAGTYAVTIRSSNSDRCWCGSFDMPVGWKTVVIAIPGTTAGTWDKTNTLGLLVRFCTAAGTAAVGVAGWQSGNFQAPPGCSNGIAQTNKALIITDVGLYIDPDKTGLAPPWQTPDFHTELAKCQRYYENMSISDLFMMTRVDGGQQMGQTWWFTVHKRAAPTVTITNTGTGVAAYMAGVNGVEFLTATMQTCAINTAKAIARM